METNIEKKQGFSLMGLLFGAYYYVGYEKMKKGLILGSLSSFPLFGLFINIYLGFKAKKELPIGEIKFNWKNVAILFVVQIVLGSILFSLSPAGKKEEILSDISGVWKTQNSNETITIDFTDNEPFIKINTQVLSVKVQEVDIEKDIIQFKINNSLTWYIKKIYGNNDDFTLLLQTNTGEKEHLYFIKNL